MTLGLLTLYITSFRQGLQAFQSILSAVGGMYENNLYMSNLFSFLAIPSSLRQQDLPPVTKSLNPVELGIRFDHVSFKYPGQERWVLRDIDLFIPQGHCLALVGHNGAGKTTFTKLLTRLYNPTEGRILLDGIDLQQWDQDALRQRIGVIFQDFNRYQLSFRENITLGNIQNSPDRELFQRAIDQSGAATIVPELPQGTESQVGRWFNDGVELSGGQWQKIALARAYMRENADILVLDEPTAALDAEAEAAVFERFRALTKGRTTILISHRFPTVRMSDTIIVIEDGCIIEQGSHDQLMTLGKRYAGLFALQARGYI